MAPKITKKQRNHLGITGGQVDLASDIRKILRLLYRTNETYLCSHKYNLLDLFVYNRMSF